MMARLIFAVDGATVRLVRRQLVDLHVRAAPLPDRAGTYVDLRDANDRTLARVPARGLFPTTHEVFPEPPERRIVRRPGSRPGAVVVTVPVVPRVATIAVIRVPAEATARTVQTLARFPWEAR